jgi:crotonobetainyl-CoA:carnitine CoA-transferase CaiB-like acyl-CoA transferase
VPEPRLVYCSLSGYGQDGPYRDVKAYDLMIQGEAGMLATTGYPDQPAKVGIPIADLATSMYAALGIVLGLFQRNSTGRGQVIDISMFESLVSWLGYFPHFYWHRGEEPVRVGMRHHFITPYGPYLARNHVYVNLAVATAKDWEVFCREVLRRPELLEDPRFQGSKAGARTGRAGTNRGSTVPGAGTRGMVAQAEGGKAASRAGARHR